jgi:DNA-binding NtrC family response regulator
MFYGHDRRPFKDMKRAIIEDFERRYVESLLEQHHFNMTAVARAAGLSRKRMIALIHKHGLYERVMIARSHIELLP